jgi:hypothetical protein
MFFRRKIVSLQNRKRGFAPLQRIGAASRYETAIKTQWCLTKRRIDI